MDFLAFSIELPEGMKVRLSNGPDFDVHSIVRSDGDRSAKLGIYLGHHPSTNSPASASKEIGDHRQLSGATGERKKMAGLSITARP